MATMKAVRIHEYGGPEVLIYEDVPRPEPAANEILLEVKASGVNPVDWKIRAGYMSDWLQIGFPFTLGSEVSGVVAATGSAVTGFHVGDEVYGYPNLMRCGSYAEFIILQENEAALKPAALDFNEAAALPVGALTAWQSFEMGGLGEKQIVLIHAAAGGVGSLAVQLAKIRGAYVIGTASGRNADFLTSIGADEIIDYQSVKFDEVVKEADMVLDLLGGETQHQSFGVLKKGGVLISAAQPPDAQRAEAYGIRAGMVQALPNAAQLQQIAQWADAGRIKSFVSNVFPLSEVVEAQELSQAGRTRGKIILTP